ncbi:VWA domain-containing protein [Wenxinia saemankumensis]|uniref:von Willebrand factor type A domain-containing protein n=1 Tax=Wenxinia saemankumensis TaxID=1447782 RepID=A0A1M5ZYH7_9RHOB|nr:VWA domain-containing protein [Wenxinia saemankumensis]SHI29089.1 von Willebrand factor type A domain-containing protein [Wenxinia saemankumensis]
MRRLFPVLLMLLLPLSAPAQERPTTIIVLDGSGSMWGQVDGRTKIEIAREALAAAVADLPDDQALGLMVYGAERRGDCADIALAVPPGPVATTRDAIAAAAAGVTPLGKTPLTDAVREAARLMRSTEEAATVVLVTDGVETCAADPCALAQELEVTGVDFTAHVVGFGLSTEEGRAVSCLATETGGRFILAGDGAALDEALRMTFQPMTEVLVVPEIPTADPPLSVTLRLREAEGQQVMNAREIVSLVLEGPEGQLVEARPDYDREATAILDLVPGEWVVRVSRVESEGENTGFDAIARFVVEPGAGAQVIDLTLRGWLTVETLLWPGMVLEPGQAVPSAVAGTAVVNYQLFARAPDGTMSEDPVAAGTRGFDEGVPPGDYILRGTFARTVTRDMPVSVGAGETVLVAFDFGLAPVTVAALDAAGQPVTRQTAGLADGPDEGAWVRGSGGPNADGTRNPFFLPPGVWRMNVGQEGGGTTRSEILVRVTEPGQPVEITVGEGARLSEDDLAALTAPDRIGCAAIVGAGHKACLVPYEADHLAPAASEPGLAAPEPMPRDLSPRPEAPSALLGGSVPFVPVETWGIIAEEIACTGSVIMLDADGFAVVRVDPAGTGTWLTGLAAWCVPDGPGARDCRPLELSLDRGTVLIDSALDGQPGFRLEERADSAFLQFCPDGAGGCGPLALCGSNDMPPPGPGADRGVTLEGGGE